MSADVADLRLAAARNLGRHAARELGVDERRGRRRRRRDRAQQGVLRGLRPAGDLPADAARGAPAARRALLAALGDWARARGASRAYLQVERDTAPALAPYAGAGFREAYGNHYRVRPAERR